MNACDHADQESTVGDGVWHVRCLNDECRAYWTEPLRNADYVAARSDAAPKEG